MKNEKTEKTGRLISHSEKENDYSRTYAALKHRIVEEGDMPYASVEHKIDILKKLNSFELGRFLINNKGGWNGHWTHHVLMHGINKKIKSYSDFENFYYYDAPVVKATQERFKIFLKVIQKLIKNDISICSIPCGVMGELLLLDYSKFKNIKLTGIDLDDSVFEEAELLSGNIKNNTVSTRFIKQDACFFFEENEYDIISSNGLNIYINSKQKLIDLYSRFYKALKKNGKLVTAYLAYPPEFKEKCEWDLDVLDKDNYRKCIVFAGYILKASWMNYLTKNEMVSILKTAGFNNIKLYYDTVRMNPTVLAEK